MEIEVSVGGFIFTHVKKYFYGPLKGGGGERVQKIPRSSDMWFGGLVRSWGEITTDNWSGIGVT